MFYINYDGCNTAELYGVDDDKVEEISEIAAKVSTEVLQNVVYYSWRNKKGAGLHKGKILQRIFKEITDFQERIIVVSFIDNLVSYMNHQLEEQFKKYMQ